MLECSLLCYNWNGMKRMKTSKQIERHVKGVANHRRIDILFLVAANDGITVEAIADHLQCNFKTASEHTRRLTQAGLVEKKYRGRTVCHSLSPYGKIFRTFLTTFQHSWECWNVVFCKIITNYVVRHNASYYIIRGVRDAATRAHAWENSQSYDSTRGQAAFGTPYRPV